MSEKGELNPEHILYLSMHYFSYYFLGCLTSDDNIHILKISLLLDFADTFRFALVCVLDAVLVEQLVITCQ